LGVRVDIEKYLFFPRGEGNYPPMPFGKICEKGEEKRRKCDFEVIRVK
jgi:hypothetical protein